MICIILWVLGRCSCGFGDNAVFLLSNSHNVPTASLVIAISPSPLPSALPCITSPLPLPTKSPSIRLGNPAPSSSPSHRSHCLPQFACQYGNQHWPTPSPQGPDQETGKSGPADLATSITHTRVYGSLCWANCVGWHGQQHCTSGAHENFKFLSIRLHFRSTIVFIR